MERSTAVAFIIILLAGMALTACDSTSGPKCGPGTLAQGNSCLPLITSCADGTVAQDGECVPACGSGQRWDGTACVDLTECAPGTILQDDQCVPACSGDQYFDGQECQPIPECGPGTVFDAASGDCQPSSQACAPGTTLVDGMCQADLACGPGTHQEGDQCILDGQTPADVPESEEPGVPAQFDLPQADGQIVLGGTVDLPEDMNGDGYPDYDFDIFTFEAQAGTWLRISASSAGAALPAFIIDSDEMDSQGNMLYRRMALSPTDPVCSREVYLPRTGSYYIAVSDHNNVAAYLFGYDPIPVGGPEFSYQVVVENLGSPSPSAVSLPHEVDGPIQNGQLSFYSVSGPSGQALEITHRGVAPPGMDSDLYPALLVLDQSDNLLTEYVSYSTWERAGVLLAPDGVQTYLVVQDHLLTAGANLDASFAVRALSPTDCQSQDCANGVIDESDSQLLAWNLTSGQFFVAGTYFPQNGETMIYQTLLDENFQALSEQAMAHPFQYGMATHYAESDETIYLWLRFGDGAPLADYMIEATIIDTPQLTPGEHTGLEINSMPPYTLWPAAIEHISGSGGKMVFFSQMVTHDGPGFWSTPFESIMTPDMQQMGPVVDTNSWNFPDGYCSPLFTYIPDDGHYLHYLFDANGDIENSTYDVTMSEYDTKDLGQAVVGTPVSMVAQSLSGMGFYTFTGQKNQYMEITVNPAMFSSIQPKIWVMNFGSPYFYWVSYIWLENPESPQLGLVVDETGPAQSEAFTAGYISPYDGMSILLVMDESGTAGAWDLFTVEISVPEAPANNSCDQAEAISLAGGSADLSGSNLSATSTVAAQQCADGAGDGPEVFYSLDLAAGDHLQVTADSEEFAPVIYLFSDCADVAGTCQAGAWNRPAELEFTVPADSGGTYYLAVDAVAGGGAFTLSLQLNAE